MIKNIFSQEVTQELINRINQITPNQQPLWGKMSADQVLAHCNVPYSYTFEPEKFKKPGFLMGFMLKTFVKKMVTGEKPYPKNSRTAPEFVMVGSKDFEVEKAKLIANIQKCQQLGESYFEGKENHSFGKMNSKEWNVLFYKHLDHHLTQFGV
jgi:hypothetical protein